MNKYYYYLWDKLLAVIQANVITDADQIFEKEFKQNPQSMGFFVTLTPKDNQDAPYLK